VAEKTEQPTARRLRQARKEGDSPVSASWAQSIALVVAVAVVPGAVRALWANAARGMRDALAPSAHLTTASLIAALESAGAGLLALALPLIAAVGAAGAFAQVVQSGGVFAVGRLAPKLERLDPAAGFKRLFSPTRFFAVFRALVAGTLVAALAYVGLRSHVADLARTAGRSSWVGAVVSGVAGALAWQVAFLGVLLGALDWVVTRRAWLRRLRMSKQEVSRERRESEGDPHMKAARERAHRELLAQATIAGVRNATVVVVNPTHLACALRYDQEAAEPAPVVVATGEGDLAAGIVRAAHAYGVPVVTDVPLAHALLELTLGEMIPEALYAAVAEVLREIGGTAKRPALVRTGTSGRARDEVR
jgi:type III secretion protein U